MALLHTAVAKRISLGKAWREISPTGWLCCESSHMKFCVRKKRARIKRKNFVWGYVAICVQWR